MMFLSVSGCADFDGDRFEQVVKGREIELRTALPPGYQITGEVSAEVEHTIDGNDGILWGLWCDVDLRFERRMKRAAARAGGELLIGFDCEHDEFEDRGPEHDDPDTWAIETELTCRTRCTAEVARLISRDAD